MKRVFCGMMVVSALAGALALSAQAPQASQTSQGAPTAPAGQTAPAATAPAATAQTADEIVTKYVTAIGGKDAIGQVKSISMETSVQVMGNDAPSTTVILDGVGYKTEIDINGARGAVFHRQGRMECKSDGRCGPTPRP